MMREKPKILFAPMEGIGSCYYRRVHHRLFPEGIWRYYTPFLSVYPNLSFRKRDLREILGEDEALVSITIPQILAGSADEIIWASGALYEQGFPEVNINMGCPSVTVVRKGRGSGLLADAEALDRLLYRVFEAPGIASGDVKLSVKTRIGISDPAEFKAISSVLSKYPFSELIIHPRVRDELYAGTVHADIFRDAAAVSSISLVYNGDLMCTGDIDRISEYVPSLEKVMLGRGLLIDPALAREYAGGNALNAGELKCFMEELEAEYRQAGTSEQQILCKLKELWSYWGRSSVIGKGPDTEKCLHKIRVSHSLGDYRNAVRQCMAGS